MHDGDLALPVGTVASDRWAIRFLSQPKTTAWGRVRSTRWRWTGRGTLVINGSDIQLQGRRHRFLWLPAPQRIELAAPQIRNVAVTGRVVQFEADAGFDKPELVRFAAKDTAAARAIAEVLPTTCTPEFARIKAEQEAFALALQQLGTRPWVTPSGSSLNPVRQALLTYVDERGRALEVLSSAALTNNVWNLQRGKKMMADSNDAAKRVSQLLAKVR